jgi:hypothetical protein
VLCRFLGLGIACSAWLAAGQVRAEVLVPAMPADDEPTQEGTKRAQEAYARAQKNYAKDAMKQALLDATEAYEALPNASTALIRAIILGDLERHLEAFEAYLVALNLGVDADQRPYVDEGLAALGPQMKPQLGWVAVVAKPEAAWVDIGGTRFTSPMTVGVTPGFHKITVSAQGYQPTTAGFTVAAGIGQRLEYQLNRTVVVPPDTATEVKIVEASATGLSPMQIAGWAGIGTGAAAVIVGASLHGWSATLRDDTEYYGGGTIPGMSEARRHDLYTEAKNDLESAQIGAWVMYAVGVAAAGTGVLLLLLEPGPPDEIEEDDPGLVPGASPAPGGGVLWLRGRY